MVSIAKSYLRVPLIIYECVCMHVCAYMSVCKCVYACVRVCECACARTRARVCVCRNVCAANDSSTTITCLVLSSLVSIIRDRTDSRSFQIHWL